MIQPGNLEPLLIQLLYPVGQSLTPGERCQGNPELVPSEAQQARPGNELADQRIHLHRGVGFAQGSAKVFDQVEAPVTQPSHNPQAGHRLRGESCCHGLALLPLLVATAIQ